MRPDDVARVRDQYPGVRVAVHPECRPEVVRMTDGAGSTTYLIAAARDAAPGATVAIGTEINLVRRLAHEHPDKTIVPVREGSCANMGKVTEAKLAATLARLDEAEPVRVDPALAEPARLALNRMLEACAQ
jgi:quinolinate synthase